VDHRVGVDGGDDVERLVALGEVGRPERDVRGGVDAEPGVVVVDDDDLVVAGEAVDDPAPGRAAAAGDEDCLHASASPSRGKNAPLRRKSHRRGRVAPPSVVPGSGRL